MRLTEVPITTPTYAKNIHTGMQELVYPTGYVAHLYTAPADQIAFAPGQREPSWRSRTAAVAACQLMPFANMDG